MFCLIFAMSQCVLLQILFLLSMFCLVFITSQRWTCLVSGSVLVKHVLSGVLSGVCDVTMMYVSCCRLRSCQACSLWCLRCYNACILLQILFLLRESGVCSVRDHGVHAMLQQCICRRFFSCRVCSVRCLCCTRPWSTCSVTMMHMSCCRFCSRQACSVWCCCRFCSC